MRILFVCNSSDSVINFRKNLILNLKALNYDVSVLCFDAKRKNEIEGLDVSFYLIDDNNRSLNPFKLLTLKDKIKNIIKIDKPDIVFTFQLKPNIFGVLGAKKAGIKNIFSMVEGTGDPFIYNTLKWKVIRAVVCFLYKKSFKNSKKVFFLNNDDKQEFIDRKLVKAEQCEMVHGIGVDLDGFAFKPIKNHNVFLMIARMLQTKGIFEYCECARRVKQKYPDVVFNYLGAEGTVKLQDIQAYIDDGSINYLGTTTDVRPFIEDCTALLLPSYREGMPVTVMEAQACGRMVIVSNTNGCRDTVIDGQNGFLSPIKNVDAIVEKVIWCIEHPDEVVKICKNARDFAEQHFNQKMINKKLLSVINNG